MSVFFSPKGKFTLSDVRNLIYFSNVVKLLSLMFVHLLSVSGLVICIFNNPFVGGGILIVSFGGMINLFKMVSIIEYNSTESANLMSFRDLKELLSRHDYSSKRKTRLLDLYLLRLSPRKVSHYFKSRDDLTEESQEKLWQIVQANDLAKLS